MRPETEKILGKVKRISMGLRTVCKGLMVLTAVVFIVAAVSVLAGTGVAISFSDVLIPVAPLSILARLVLIVILALSMGVMAKGLYHLDRLFSNYARGEIFTTQAASQIRQLGFTAILWAGVGIIWGVAALSFTRTRPMSFHLHLDSIFIGVAIIAISWFMEAAAEMREENDLTI